MTDHGPLPQLELLLSLVERAGLDLDAVDLADALWLAQWLPPPPPPEVARPQPAEQMTTPSAPTAPTNEKPLASDPPKAPTPEPIADAPPRPSESSVPVFARSQSAREGIAIRVPSALALPDALALGRALRPLRRRVQSRHLCEMDVEATVKRVAELAFSLPQAPWLPALRPAVSRWLDATVVVDRAQTVAVGRRTIEELQSLLQRLGAFRDVRLQYLVVNREGRPRVLPPRLAASGTTQDGGEPEPHSRRLVLVVSDCVASYWRGKPMADWLRKLGEGGPLALVQLLPPHLWERTALGAAELVSLQSAEAGAPNRRLLQLDADGEPLDPRAAQAEVPVPVMSLRPEALALWARLLCGNPKATLAGYRFTTSAGPTDGNGPPRADGTELDAQERVARFWRSCSPEARQLAVYLSAAPLSLPVMRLVWRMMVPKARQEHLAEVILGGLIRQLVPDLWLADLDTVAYEFRSGVRDELLARLGATEAAEVYRRVGRFIAARLGTAFDFSAMLHSSATPTSGLVVEEVHRPFAEVAASILRRIGKQVVVPQERIAGPKESLQSVAAAPFTGRWILVAGTASMPVDAQVEDICTIVGRTLAQGGYGLVTGEALGVAGLTAKAFLRALSTEGGAGQARLRHVMADDGSPSPDAGYVLRVPKDISKLEVLLAAAHALVLIGGEAGTRRLWQQARIAELPVLPIPGTGGVADEAAGGLSGNADTPTKSERSSAVVARLLPSLEAQLFSRVFLPERPQEYAAALLSELTALQAAGLDEVGISAPLFGFLVQLYIQAAEPRLTALAGRYPAREEVASVLSQQPEWLVRDLQTVARYRKSTAEALALRLIPVPTVALSPDWPADPAQAPLSEAAARTSLQTWSGLYEINSQAFGRGFVRACFQLSNTIGLAATGGEADNVALRGLEAANALWLDKDEEELSRGMIHVASMLAARQAYSDAWGYFSSGIEYFQRANRPKTKPRSYAISMLIGSEILAKLGRSQEAWEHATQAVDGFIGESVLSTSADAAWAKDLLRFLAILARRIQQTGRNEKVVSSLRAGLHVLVRLILKLGTRVIDRDALAGFLTELAVVFGDWSEGIQVLTSWIHSSLASEIRGHGPELADFATYALADLAERGRLSSVRPIATIAIELIEASGDDAQHVRDLVSTFNLSPPEILEKSRGASSRPLLLYMCCAPEDKKMSRELVRSLAAMERQGLVELWNEDRVAPGTLFEAEMYRQLERSDIVLLLVSPSFFASSYCAKITERILQRQGPSLETTVIPILLRPSLWNSAPFGHLQPLPATALPITSWDDRGAAWMNVVDGIRQFVDWRRPPPAKNKGTLSEDPMPKPSPPTPQYPAQPAAPIPLFAWIHLSDLYFGIGDAARGWDQILVTNALRTDVETLLQQNLPAPDAILVTGDVAFSGDTTPSYGRRSSPEYAEAKRFLLSLGQVARLAPQQIFVVPGNHDVQRSADRELNVRRLLSEIRSGKETLDEALANPEDRRMLARRQANYLRFAAEFAPAVLGVPAPPEERLWWSHVLDGRGGLTVRLIGLNTALLAADDEDLGKLRLGREMLHQVMAAQPPRSRELVVVMTHHPLTGGWLADQVESARWVRSIANVHLCGHAHEAESEDARRGAGAGFVRVVSGAMHGDAAEAHVTPGQNYSLSAVMATPDGSLSLRVWPRRWSDKRRSFLPDMDSLPDGQMYAEHPLDSHKVAGRDGAAAPTRAPRR